MKNKTTRQRRTPCGSTIRHITKLLRGRMSTAGADMLRPHRPLQRFERARIVPAAGKNSGPEIGFAPTAVPQPNEGLEQTSAVVELRLVRKKNIAFRAEIQKRARCPFFII
ncbi:MAG: hypothetical protein A2633_02250 [Candidatus Sungbacteria bacterium RIFCSPHIGHO2_01_FULL_47_32]|uniref:Uncharacterized protein n=1 Tax=Candidatus Sungbacteria bacterium RIFCSPHIGHO2_01_FULL_47_32 TaxID=1802264 RepID=A0A1G2K403_9BACT|nr:MAG: hypothetical protein A2633_02250 [Candidatus Sungbacteria bacterium RIFCSPHIGHO2_01_FULL_47_32]OGZ98804.1 MAG: hypothetical protein A3D57_04695 [Candidatus Sungbacteria bacterium RIFCSPHIGHO2_02_FULL_46_12]